MDRYIILGHENPDNDSIVSGYLLEKFMKQKGYNVEFIIPDDIISEENIMLANYVGINPTQYQKPLPTDTTIKYILVDHHERDVPGEIVGIIDHHPAKTKDIKCRNYYNYPSCSTSCIIVKEHERYFSTTDIKAACFAAMVDTAAFHSTKTIVSDYVWVKYMCSKFKFNYDELITMSMCPTDITDLKKAALNGLKKHNIHDHKIASSFLHLPSPKDNQEEINQIILYLQEYIKKENYDMFAFIVHDITNFKSTLYKIREKTIEKQEYEEYTSRGTRIIPDLTEEINAYQKKKTTN